MEVVIAEPALGRTGRRGTGRARGHGRGIASSSTAVDAARAASSSASAASESCSSSDARADRTRRVFGAGASVVTVGRRRRPGRDLGGARMASIRSAFRMRVAAFTPIALAMVWSCSRSLLVSMDRSICCSGLICSLSRSRLVRRASTAADAYGNLLSARGRREIAGAGTTPGMGRLRRSSGARKPTPGSVPVVVSHDTGHPKINRRRGHSSVRRGSPARIRLASADEARHELMRARRGRNRPRARSVYSPPGPGCRESKRRYGTGAGVCVRNAHGVAWSGRRRMR